MTIHFLPGMGADSRIWDDYKKSFPHAKFHDWIKNPNAESSLTEFATAVIESYNICENDIVVGVSMGGIVAAEISNILSGIQVIQISSCKNIKQLNSFVSLISPIGSIFPFGKIAHVPNVILPDDVLRLANQMYKDSDHDFTRWSCSAIMKWEGIKSKAWLSILGDNDFIFPSKKQEPDHLIKGGTHLMVMTHSDEITTILKAQLTSR